MRHRRLLIGTTALALLAGTGMALTQGTPQREHSAPAINQPSGGDRSNPGNVQREGQGAQPGRTQSDRGLKNSDQTTGQAPPAQGQRNEGQRAQPGQNQRQGAGQSERGRAGQRDSDETTGQQTPRQPNQTPAARGQNEQQPQAHPQPGQANDRSAAETQGQGGAHANFTVEQRTRIRETVILSNNAPRASNVNFRITLGTVVPRTVRLAPLPTLIVDVEPSWRGYMYFLVGDEIIVVEPNSLKIVAVIAV
jgi:hypothetical protein